MITDRWGLNINILPTNPVSAAIIGRISWDSPEVLHALSILLGPDVEKAQRLLKEYTRGLCRSLDRACSALIEYEAEVLGDKSYQAMNSEDELEVFGSDRWASPQPWATSTHRWSFQRGF